MINASYERICVRKQQHNIGFPTFKLPQVTRNLFMYGGTEVTCICCYLSCVTKSCAQHN